MKIAFVGLPLAALLLAADGHAIVWAGICRRDAIGLRRLTKLLGKSNVALVPDLGRAAESVRERSPDLVVSWFWTKKMPRAFREIAPLGAIGVHPSLLPRHRGPDPTFWAIDAGDRETGVTAHFLDDEYDTGPLLGRERLAIDPKWNAWTLAKKLDRPSLALLRRTVKAFTAGTPKAEDQEPALATEAPAPDDDLLELRWTMTAEAVVRRVRAASPWPGAFTEIAGEIITITEACVTADVPRALEPGEAWVKGGVAIVRAGDAGVAILRGRLEDDTDLDCGAVADLVRRSTH